ncbi:C4-type zinc ribbon domain-containing protein [uncultured Desulfosarcina sp.]|uniref:zinc ribbon domain-containing protein n=1 Tax=uncultured Desulfosarcina sp. TaxID=218289 RepID=UPI0029C718CD|nr:C4-type zinc ribbon domain-containing protein [uncultured Desulfosarcina sp.]
MNDIREQIGILVEVQDVEMEINKADRQIQSLENEADALEHAAGEYEDRVSQEKTALDDLRKSYRELESESKINAAQIVKSNEKLRSVKTNKEYQSILKEIEEIRKKNSAIEDQMLERLEAIETAESTLNEKQSELADFLRECKEKKESLLVKAQRERQAVETLNEKKGQVSAKVDSKWIAVLDDVKKKVRGLAVVPVQQAICMGCHLNIPPQLFNELQRFDEIRYCPHCHRIIYWKEQDSE